MHRYSGLVRDFIFLLYCKMTTTTNEKSFTTNSVKIVDNNLIINFTSDGVEKKKTMPLTDKWLALKDWLAKIFAMPEYNPRNIWKDVKEGWVLYGLVTDLAAEAKANQEVINNEFAKLWLVASESEDAIDDL